MIFISYWQRNTCWSHITIQIAKSKLLAIIISIFSHTTPKWIFSSGWLLSGPDWSIVVYFGYTVIMWISNLNGYMETLCLINNLRITRNPITLFSFLFVLLSSCDFCVGTKFMCSQVIAPIKNEAGEVCMYILNFEDCDALPDAPNSAEHSTTVRFSKCNCIFYLLSTLLLSLAYFSALFHIVPTCGLMFFLSPFKSSSCLIIRAF